MHRHVLAGWPHWLCLRRLRFVKCISAASVRQGVGRSGATWLLLSCWHGRWKLQGLSNASPTQRPSVPASRVSSGSGHFALWPHCSLCMHCQGRSQMISLIELEARAAKCSLTSGLHAERADRNTDHFLPAACTRRLCFLCLLSVFRLCVACCCT